MTSDSNRRRARYGLARLGVTLAGLAGLVLTPLAATGPAFAGPGRRLVAIPAAVPFGQPAELSGVFCTAPENCWAVGDDETASGGTVNQIQRWDGTTWFEVPSPSPGGTEADANSNLMAVVCASSTDCLAVGGYRKDPASAELSQALHWNGKKWSVVRTPAPGGTLGNDFNVLGGVSCLAATDCWAVGSSGSFDTGTQSNQALHWNGKAWSQVKTPNPAGTGPGEGNSLVSIQCASTTDCWAGGADGQVSASGSIVNQLLHWNGTKWTTATAPNPGAVAPGRDYEIFALSCATAAICWADGTQQIATADGSETLNELLRWNGTKWSTAKAPQPGGTSAGSENLLKGLHCAAASDCWAVGIAGGNNGLPVLNQALHWNGQAWQSFSTPEPGGLATGAFNVLDSAWCNSAADCWAVGSIQAPGSGNRSRNQTLHWTGKRWFNDPSSTASSEN